MQNNKLRSTLGLALGAAIFVAIGFGVVAGAQRLIADAETVAHSHRVISQIDESEARVRDAEASQRGYLLTNAPGHMVGYNSARSEMPTLQRDLSDLVADNAAQSARARAFNGLIDHRLEQMAHTLARYRDGGLPAAQTAIGVESISTSDAIRRHALEMRAAEHGLLEQRANSTASSARILIAIALLGIPAGLSAILLVYLWLVREIRQRTRAEVGAAAANQNLRIGVEQLERGSADLRALTRYGSMLQSCKASEEAFDLTMRMLKTLLPGTAGTVYRMRNSQDHAEALASWGTHAVPAPPTIEPESCWGLRRGQPHMVAHVHDAACAHASDGGDDGAATGCFPLSAQGAQLGLLYLSDSDAGFLARTDIIEAVAEQLSMALSNLYLQERLRLQSIREPLTGLFNRRYLEESTAREFARCARRKLPVALLMLDIDNFKTFNDVHGHAGGDAVLAEFGKLLQGMSRPEDIACRYGGEEFTLIMPEATQEIALQRAEAIRQAVEAMRVQHQGATLPPLTISIGVAGFPDHGQAPDEVLRAADQALYRAKRAGRNRVELAAHVRGLVPHEVSRPRPATA